MNVNFEKLFVCFLNLYMVPLVSLWIFSKIRKRPLALSLPLAFEYTFCTISVFVLAHVPAALFKAVFGKRIVMTGSKYTVLAVLVAVSIPFIEKNVREYIEFRKNDDSKMADKNSAVKNSADGGEK